MRLPVDGSRLSHNREPAPSTMRRIPLVSSIRVPISGRLSRLSDNRAPTPLARLSLLSNNRVPTSGRLSLLSDNRVLLSLLSDIRVPALSKRRRVSLLQPVEPGAVPAGPAAAVVVKPGPEGRENFKRSRRRRPRIGGGISLRSRASSTSPYKTIGASFVFYWSDGRRGWKRG